MRDKNEGTRRGGGGERHLRPRIDQQDAEGNTAATIEAGSNMR